MSKINVVIDLDNTVICSISEKEIEKYRSTGLQYRDMRGYYRIFQRPHLREFMEYLFQNFDVTVWTAASKDYALFIIDNILLPKEWRGEYRLKMFFYDDHCDHSQKMYSPDSPKDLRYLYHFSGYHPCNTIIIDDLYDVYKANPKNIIRAPYFDAKKSDAKYDEFLKRVIPVLEDMKSVYLAEGCKGHDGHYNECGDEKRG
jgi:TFIIF-interacting CTD phosphatase-like protein